ncbi:MAG: transporter, ATP-binding protein [Herbinix sp.]|nr:transporter, ATP-binding protein [Herbinix sp.]
MLRVEHLYKELPEFALEDICFHLPKGYIMGLVGVNASGKSTLIKTLCNIYYKDSGSIFVDGLPMDENEKKVKNQLGIVLTENFYEGNFSLEKNAFYFGSRFDHYNQDIFLRYCRQFHLDPKKKLKKLSKGQQMKYQIAFALSHEATLFIMDEPTGNLDQAFRLEFREILQELIEEGDRSVLLSTHQTDILDQVADYITLLDKGRIVFSMSKEELSEQYRLVSGDATEINSLPLQMIVHLERGQYNSMALIHNPDYLPANGQSSASAETEKSCLFNLQPSDRTEYKRLLEESNLTIMLPTIEEVMFFKIKGGTNPCGNLL